MTNTQSQIANLVVSIFKVGEGAASDLKDGCVCIRGGASRAYNWSACFDPREQGQQQNEITDFNCKSKQDLKQQFSFWFPYHVWYESLAYLALTDI